MVALNGGRPIGYEWLHTVHMPIFVFASGFLAVGKTNIPFIEYLVKKAKAILIPYAAFFLLSLIAAEFYCRALRGFFVKPDFLWIKAFAVTGVPLSDLSGKMGGFQLFVLWFFATLFFAHLIFWFISKLQKQYLIAIMALSYAASLLSMKIFKGASYTTPFNISAIPNFVLFMCFAAIFRLYLIGRISKKKKLILSISLILLATLIQSTYPYMGGIKAPVTPMYIPVSLMQITGWYGLFSFIGRCKLLEYLGRISLYVYGLHIIFLGIFYAVLHKLGRNVHGNYPALLVIVVITITLCCLCFEMYSRIKFRLTNK